jgi:uncharacterized protein (TIGR03435 family)
LVVLVLCVPVFGQEEGGQLKVGEPAPALGFDKLLQAPEGAKAMLDALEGKVIVLYFWGPHARPCVDACGHMNKLAKKFQGKAVQFIAVTSCDEDTARKFTEITPIEGWIALDRDLWMFSAYRASPVPHVVVIDKQGKVAAMVKPDDLTEAAMNDLLAGKAVNLPVKEGKAVKPDWKPGKDKTEPEPILQIVIAPCDLPPRDFSFHVDKSGRRLTARAAPLPYLVALAYRADPARVVCKLPPSNERYRVSLVVPKGLEKSIYSVFQEALDSTFNLNVTWRKQSVPCLVLKRDENVPLGLTPTGKGEKGKGKSSKKDDGGSHTSFSDGFLIFSGANMDVIVGSLSEVLGAPVFDETDIEGRFDLSIRWQPGSIEALKEALLKLGLELEKDERQVKLLVIGKAGEDD